MMVTIICESMICQKEKLKTTKCCTFLKNILRKKYKYFCMKKMFQLFGLCL
uniref:Uncharacterized protein n=1 Tax=Anguilla anguilla TaxID=7936 RepID=A0A0E9PAZ4_ANGAN